MDTLTGRPRILKQANLSSIRRVIKTNKTATRSEIAAETKISFTTVRSLLTEMLLNGEIESIGFDESSGGRKAERYRFKPDRYYGIAFCITDNQIQSLLINVCGEIVETSHLELSDDHYEEAIISVLDRIVSQKDIKSIGIGVPGVVKGGSYWRKNRHDTELHQVDLGITLANKYGIPVILENDLNAITIGFNQCYQSEFPSESHENTTLAYLHFDKGCISAGFIANGKILRGYQNFAGELGLIPADHDKLLDECISESTDDPTFTNYVIQILAWICGILNPQYIALAGPDMRKNCIGPIGDGLSALLPNPMLAEIVYSPDVWHDYHNGMAYLTAGKMFDDIQLVKE